MSIYKLTRTGQPDLEIEGAELLDISSKDHQTNRWHELAVYQLGDSEGGGYLAYLAYRSQWEQEAPGHYEVREGQDLHALFGQLKDYDPCQYARLQPEHSEDQRRHNGPRNEERRRVMRRGWARLIESAANTLGYVERRGRPKEIEGETKQVGLRMSVDLIARIDAARGTQGMSEWMREAAELRLSSDRPTAIPKVNK